MAWLHKAWQAVRLYVALALVAVSGLLFALWRAAVGRRKAAEKEAADAKARADSAARSAEREREHGERQDAVRETFRQRRFSIEDEARKARAEVEARPKPTTKDELAAELNRRMEERKRNGQR